jgi:catechol-2,3-dioxygenase
MDVTIVQPNARYEEWSSAAMIESISAVTLATHNMSRAVAFYRMLGFEIVHGALKKISGSITGILTA